MKWAILLLVALPLLCGCKKNIQNEAAVKDGILKYLAIRANLHEMDVSVTSVSFRGNEADATVHFQARGNSNPAAGLEMKYILEQHGNEWQVKGRPASASNHGAGMNPGGMNPHGGGMPGASMTLPPGHPAIPSAVSPK